jgi:hypothetical protein
MFSSSMEKSDCLSGFLQTTGSAEYFTDKLATEDQVETIYYIYITTVREDLALTAKVKDFYNSDDLADIADTHVVTGTRV